MSKSNIFLLGVVRNLWLTLLGSVSKRYCAVVTLIVIISIPIAACNPSSGASSQSSSQEQVQIKGAVQSQEAQPHSYKADLRTLPPSMPWREGDPVTEEPRGLDPTPQQPSPQPIPQALTQTPTRANNTQAVQSFISPGLTMASFTVPDFNFDGIGFTGVLPPDTVGDVGPNHYIQATNGGGTADTQFQIFDKMGNSLAGPLSTNATIWSTLPAASQCRTDPLTDPIVLYDHLADRWLIGEFARATGAWTICLAVSQGPDPVTNGWFSYEFVTSLVPDYIKFGVWPDGYYASTQRGFPFSGLDVWVFDRATILNGNPTTFQTMFIAGWSLFLLPSDLDGPAPATGTPNYYARQIDGDQWGGVDRVEVFEFAVDWANPANTTFTGPAALPVAAFDTNLCNIGNLFDDCVPQPGTTQLLETLPHWPMWRLQYRNFSSHSSLVFNHTVDVDGTGHAGIRWYELRDAGTGWTVYQQGTFSPDEGAPGLDDDVFRWMGSIAMDQDSNLALGYSVSSSTVFPGVRYVGRLAGDTLGQMTQGPVTVIDGLASQTGSDRWGDYSSMNVDPVDDCTFWYTQEYIRADGRWATRIASFRFDSCGNQPPVALCKDVTVDANASCKGVVAPADVDNGSFDPDGDPITLALVPPGPFDLGATSVTLTVTDDQGASDSCPATVTVVDNTPAIINDIAATPEMLWPPNHQMVAVSVSVSATDNCDATPMCRIISVSSNEPVNGIGDGNTAPDWEITGDLTVNLRAERSGGGSGREYTVTVQCTDAGGSSTMADTTVFVPHDRGM